MKRQIYLYSSFFLILIFFGGIFLSGVSFTGRAVDEDCKGSFFECLAKNAKTPEKQNEEKISVEDKLTNNNFFEEQETNIFENDFNSFQYRSRDNMFLGQNDFLLSDRENENFPINKGENIGEYEGYIVEFEEKPLLVLKSDLEEEVSYKKETEAQTKGVSKFILKTFSKDSEILEEEASVKLEKQREILQQTSENFKAKLEEESISREIISEEFYFSFSGVSVGKLTKEEKEKIESMPGIKRVTPNYRVKAFLMDSVSLVEADLVWQISDPNNSSLNLTGEGIKIAIIDTGIDYTHPDLGSCTSSSFLKGKCEKVLGGYDFVNNDFDPMDDNGHGTHCASIAAGKGILKGVAPDAKLYGFKVLSSAGGGDFSDVISAIERSVDLNNNGIPLEDENDYVDIISLSLGGQGNPDDPVSQAIDNVVSAGVIAVIAVGNDGLWNGPIGSPATSRKAISVGASDKNDLMASFSSRGPVLWEDAQGKIKSLSKPDVVAPGDGFFSSQGICAAQWNDAWSNRECIDNQHTSIPGTSMATPHVAGAVALIKQAHPDWSPEEIKMVLKNSAQNLNGAGIKDQGQGRINVLSSLNSSKPLIASLNEIDYLPSGQMNILGSAKGDNFTNYTLSYSPQGKGNWSVICYGNNQLNGGIFCKGFNTINLIEGKYDLKLEVYGANSLHSEDYGIFEIDKWNLSPLSKEVFSSGEQINILASTYFYNYDSYSLRYRREGTSSWFTTGLSLINYSNPNSETIIQGQLNSSNFQEGGYELLLEVSYFEGNEIVQERINFHIYNSPYLDLGLGYSSKRDTLILDDLNSDGTDEIIFTLLGNQGCELFVLDSNLTSIFNSSSIIIPNCWVCSPPSIGDINGDGAKEIIFIVNENYPSPDFGKGKIYVYDYGGSRVSGWPKIFPGAFEDNLNPLSIGDLDGDGSLELVAISGGGVCGQCSDHGEIYVFDGQGNIKNGWPYVFGQNIFVGSSLILANLDQEESTLEIVVTESDKSMPLLINSSILSFWFNGTEILDFRTTLFPFWGWTQVAGDINSNGLKEVISQIGPLNTQGQFLSWNHPEQIYSPISLGDFLGDTKLEILFGSLDGKLYLTNSSGSPLSGWPIQETDSFGDIFSADGTHLISDFIGDDSPEIITGWIDNIGYNTRSSPGIYMYYMNGSTVKGFPIFKEALSTYSLAIGDLEGNNKPDLVWIGGTESTIGKRFLFVKESDKNITSKTFEWPMYLHDPRHTGAYVSNNNSPIVGCSSNSLIGDANADGAINSVDALLISQVFVQLIPTPNNICCLDVNRDGAINSADSLLVMRYFVGYPNTGYAGQLCSSI